MCSPPCSGAGNTGVRVSPTLIFLFCSSGNKLCQTLTFIFLFVQLSKLYRLDPRSRLVARPPAPAALSTEA